MDIKVGDLVMVVGACCMGQARHHGIQGVPWRVTKFSHTKFASCSWCGTKFPSVTYAYGAPERCPRVWVKWLKRLDDDAVERYDAETKARPVAKVE